MIERSVTLAHCSDFAIRSIKLAIRTARRGRLGRKGVPASLAFWTSTSAVQLLHFNMAAAVAARGNVPSGASHKPSKPLAPQAHPTVKQLLNTDRRIVVRLRYTALLDANDNVMHASQGN